MTTKRIALISILAMAVALSFAWPAAAQMVYVTSKDAKTITVIQGSTNSIVATIPTANVPGPIAITPDALWAYVANVSQVATFCADPANPTGSVTVVDLTKNSEASVISVGRCPNGIGITPNGTEVYVSNFGDNSVSVINTATKSVSFTINSVMPPQFRGPSGLTVTADGKSVYVTSFGVTSVIDTASHGVVIEISAGGDNVAEPPQGGPPWISFGPKLTAGANSMFVGCTAGPVVFTPDGARAYLLDSECGDIYDIAVGSFGVIRKFPNPHIPGGGFSSIAISSDGQRLYRVGDVSGPCCDSELVIFETANDTALASIVLTGVFNIASGGIAVAPTLGAAGNTPVGAPIIVSPPDATGATPVTVTFASVTAAGNTTLTTVACPTPPVGYVLGSTCFDISTTATFSTATVCIVDPGIVSTSRLLHYSGGTPTDVTDLAGGFPDVVNHRICSTPLTSLSPFAVARLFFETTTAVSSSANPSVYGQAVSFTATVAAILSGAPKTTGTIQFAIDGSSFGAPVPLDASGKASVTATALAVGTHSVTAFYSGTALFGTSSGSLADGQVVNRALTTTTLVASANPSVFEQAVSFIATVAPVAPGAGAPGGSVTFLDGGVALATVSLNASSHATLTTSGLSVGSHSISATYAGDANFQPSASSPLAEILHALLEIAAKKALLDVEDGRGEVQIAGTLQVDGANPQDLRAGASTVAASVRIAVDGTTVANQDLVLQIKSDETENWEFKDRSSASGISDFKIHWLRPAKFDTGEAAGLPRIRSKMIGFDETLLRVDLQETRLPISIDFAGLASVAIALDGTVTTSLDHKLYKSGRFDVTLPFRLEPGMVITISGVAPESIVVQEGVNFLLATSRFSIEAAFDPALLGPGAHKSIELDLTIGNAIVGKGSMTIPITMESKGDHAEFDGD